jgi:hypothetical protein
MIAVTAIIWYVWGNDLEISFVGIVQVTSYL